MGYFPRSKIQQAIEAALSDDRLEEYTAGDVEHAWQETLDSCLAKVDDDEPIFVLRAQDESSVRTIRFWLGINGQIGGNRASEVGRIILEFQQWQTEHPERVKMAD